MKIIETSVQGHSAEQVNEIKLLGVVINCKLHFDSHVEFILRQFSQRMYLIKLLRKTGSSWQTASYRFSGACSLKKSVCYVSLARTCNGGSEA
jgi:hypothetical protein